MSSLDVKQEGPEQQAAAEEDEGEEGWEDAAEDEQEEQEEDDDEEPSEGEAAAAAAAGTATPPARCAMCGNGSEVASALGDLLLFHGTGGKKPTAVHVHLACAAWAPRWAAACKLPLNTVRKAHTF